MSTYTVTVTCVELIRSYIDATDAFSAASLAAEKASAEAAPHKDAIARAAAKRIEAEEALAKAKVSAPPALVPPRDFELTNAQDNLRISEDNFQAFKKQWEEPSPRLRALLGEDYEGARAKHEEYYLDSALWLDKKRKIYDALVAAKIAADNENPITQAEVWTCEENLRKAKAAENLATVAGSSSVAMADKAVREKQQCEDRLTQQRGKLPNDLRDLPLPTLRATATIRIWTDQRCVRYDADDWEMITTGEISVSPSYIHAGIIRGELPYLARQTEAGWGYDAEGYLTFQLRHPALDLSLRVIVDIAPRDWLVVHRERFDTSCINKIIEVIPEKHQSIKLHSIQPWPKSPIPVKVQEQQLAALNTLPRDFNGWVILGPWGSSKTAFVSAWLTDEITFRAVDREYIDSRYSNSGYVDSNLCVWRIKAGRWVLENQDWILRNRDDKDVRRPSLTISDIEDACEATGFSPILWIEEIDKFSPTKYRSDLLDSLIDEIYERNGLVIITSNHTQETLANSIGGAAYRRFMGTNEDETEKFVVWDFHAKPKSGKKAAATSTT